MRNLQAVIFDMDGLILDTERVYSEGWQKGATAKNIQLPPGFVENAAGRSVDDNIGALKAAGFDHELIHQIRKEREAYFYEQLDRDEIPVKPYFFDLIHFLRQQGIKTGLATSSYQGRVQRMFDHYQFHDLFDVVVAGDQVSRVKPDPEIYLQVLSQLQTAKEESLVLEDSVVGGRAASSGGIPFILVPDKSAAKSQTVPDPFPNLLGVKESLGTVLEWLKEFEHKD
ncbi:HAD family phosphatase [Enterococcus asini]|uniref:HAD family hydrolase n=1 Tax=Enterococcus asini TaxID=57732 RepID=UPI001E2B0832|nr:HAD family phosphatase [Enterococcus asini]MCD5028074.1 HAD family phosphatase [Enterococcus asini]MDT2783776.1 HAD family phosphatase [Enterococcus asini]